MNCLKRCDGLHRKKFDQISVNITFMHEQDRTKTYNRLGGGDERVFTPIACSNVHLKHICKSSLAISLPNIVQSLQWLIFCVFKQRQRIFRNVAFFWWFYNLQHKLIMLWSLTYLVGTSIFSERGRETRRKASRRSAQRASCHSHTEKQNNIINREIFILAM